MQRYVFFVNKTNFLERNLEKRKFHKACGGKIMMKMLYNQSGSMKISEGQLLYYI